MTPRPRARLGALVLFALGAALLPWDGLRAQQTASATRQDSVAPVFRRAQRLVNDGNGAEGRRLVDSVLNATEPRSPEEAEALFWRATLAESWEHAQRDYLRLMLEHERSARSADAMLRLAQGEATRGDRDAAIRYLERLEREAPASGARAEGGLWHGRLLIERGARSEGCAVLRMARPLLGAEALELANQYDYLLRGCPDPTAAPPPAPAAAPPAAAPPSTVTTPAPRTPTPSTPPAAGAAWSVQVAAMGSAAEAQALVARLRAKGYEARVDGGTAPFRVRFGRFPTRAAAAAAAEDYKTKERAGAFVVEAPRE